MAGIQCYNQRRTKVTFVEEGTGDKRVTNTQK